MLAEEKIIWTNGLWDRRDYWTLMDGWVVRYRPSGRREVVISASRNRVCLDGVSIGMEGAKDSLLRIIERAWRQHRHLAQRSSNNPLPEDS